MSAGKPTPKPALPYDLQVSIVIYKPSIPKLRQCLESVKACKLRLRVFVVDNSPEPLPAEMVAALDGRFSYIFGHGNLGFGGGHNLAMLPHAAEGRYWLVLNPDTYFKPGLLEELAKRMDADPRIGLCIPRVCNPDGTIQLVNKRLPTPGIFFVRPFVAKIPGLMRVPFLNYMLMRWMGRFLLQDMNLAKPLVCPFVSGCFHFIRAAWLPEVGGYDERYFLYMEDLDLSRRFARRGLNVVFSDLACYHHWERAAYKSRKVFLIMVSSCAKYFNKWRWVFDFERRRINKRVRYYRGPGQGGERV
jgi:GT2 family glycosyltransferase